MKFDAAFRALNKGKTLFRTQDKHSQIKIVKSKMVRTKRNGVVTEARLSGKDLMSEDWTVLKVAKV